MLEFSSLLLQAYFCIFLIVKEGLTGLCKLLNHLETQPYCSAKAPWARFSTGVKQSCFASDVGPGLAIWLASGIERLGKWVVCKWAYCSERLLFPGLQRFRCFRYPPSYSCLPLEGQGMSTLGLQCSGVSGIFHLQLEKTKQGLIPKQWAVCMIRNASPGWEDPGSWRLCNWGWNQTPPPSVSGAGSASQGRLGIHRNPVDQVITLSLS